LALICWRYGAGDGGGGCGAVVVKKKIKENEINSLGGLALISRNGGGLIIFAVMQSWGCW